MTEPDSPTTDIAPSPAPEFDPGPEPESSRQRRGAGFVLAVSLAVLFAVAAAVLGAMLLRGSDDDALDDLRATSGRFAEALVSYDYHDPDAHRDAVLELSTGSFRKQYQDAFDKGLGEIITKVQAVSTAYVKDVYLSSVDSNQAQAIVVVDIEHDGSSGPKTLYDVYFRLTLLDLDGHWLVDDVTDLNFGAGGAAGAGVTTDTSTATTATTATSVP